MFVRIQNHIINIAEIRNATVEEVYKGKFNINIYFKDGYKILLSEKDGEEARSIFHILDKACLNYKNN